MAQYIYESPNRESLAANPSTSQKGTKYRIYNIFKPTIVLDELSLPMSGYGENKKVEDKVKPYTIQLISYKDKNRAEKTVGAFKRKGYQASMMRENGWYQVCVGSYLNKKEAEEDLKNFSQKYKDCFLRAKNK